MTGEVYAAPVEVQDGGERRILVSIGSYSEAVWSEKRGDYTRRWHPAETAAEAFRRIDDGFWRLDGAKVERMEAYGLGAGLCFTFPRA